MLSMFWSSQIRTALTANALLAATSLPAEIAGLPFALLTKGERANEQPNYAPASNRRRR